MRGRGRLPASVRRQLVKALRKLPAGMTSARLARRLDVSPATARQLALEHGYALAPAQGRGRPPGSYKPVEERVAHNPPWSGVNWLLTDTEIARRLGKSRERVRQVRRELEKPSSRELRHVRSARRPDS